MSESRRSFRVPVVLGYAAGAAAWIYGDLNVDPTYHEFAVFVAVVVFHALFGAALGRVWGVALPLLLIPLSLPAGRAGGDLPGDLNEVWEFVLIATPFTVAATALGYAARRVGNRLAGPQSERTTRRRSV